jgi:NADPH-dependent 2,4-dienoyl-CoA reductase/sulfur reductase-like enzyme
MSAEAGHRTTRADHTMLVPANVGGSDSRRHRAVIIGAGFGGLYAARALSRAPVDVVVIGRTNETGAALYRRPINEGTVPSRQSRAIGR